ncbi:MAG TPA: PH domain-containing protein [Actinomycetales bacterium]
MTLEAQVDPAPPVDAPWRRLHPLTPLVRGWKGVAAALVIVGQQRGDDLLREGLPGRTEALISLAVVAAVAVIGGVYALLAWRRARYRVDERTLELHTGVVFRQERRAPLDRLQAVDVVRPLLARIFGLAELRLEVAGSGSSSIRLSLLPEAEAQNLRSTLLARAAGLAYEGETAPEAPEHEVLLVPVARTVESLLRHGPTLFALVLLVVAVVAAVVRRDVSPLAAFVPIGFGVSGLLWSRFTGGFGFRVATSPDGVRLHHGLLTTTSQTVPPGRVQAVRLRQPLLWRSKDWWRVEVNVAGYGAGGGGDAESTDEHLLLTVGSRAEALAVASLALPLIAASEGSPYDQLSAQLLDAGLTGRGDDAGFVSSPRSARLLDPVGWRRHGVRVTTSALLVRRGVVVRELDVVPHARTQSLALQQGPLQRRLGLATFVLHSTPGPVSPSVQHLPVGAAMVLLQAQAERATAARAGAGDDGRWMLGR